MCCTEQFPNTDTSLIFLKPGCKANNCCAVKVSDKPGKSASETPEASIRSGITWTHWVLVWSYQDLGVLRSEVNIIRSCSALLQEPQPVCLDSRTGRRQQHPLQKATCSPGKDSREMQNPLLASKKKITQLLSVLTMCVNLVSILTFSSFCSPDSKLPCGLSPGGCR